MLVKTNKREGEGLSCRPVRRSVVRLLAWTRNRMLRTIESPAMEALFDKNLSNTLLTCILICRSCIPVHVIVLTTYD